MFLIDRSKLKGDPKAMRNLLAFFLLVLVAFTAYADTDATASTAAEVRQAVLLAMATWSHTPINPTACGSSTANATGDCCTQGDAKCTEFARDYIKPHITKSDGGGWAYLVEIHLTENSTQFTCNPQIIESAGGHTPCGTLPAASVVLADVADALSDLAAAQIP